MKRNYSNPCSSVEFCNENKGLTCENFICVCADNKFYYQNQCGTVI